MHGSGSREASVDKISAWVTAENDGWNHKMLFGELPSGKRLHSYRTSPFLRGKPSINGQFSIANCKRLPEGNHLKMLIYASTFFLTIKHGEISGIFKRIHRVNLNKWGSSTNG